MPTPSSNSAGGPSRRPAPKGSGPSFSGDSAQRPAPRFCAGAAAAHTASRTAASVESRPLSLIAGISPQVSETVLEQRADGDGGGLGAERAASERDDRPASRARVLYLPVLPPALGADERGDGRGALARRRDK